jgi:primosomal protein N' (replication factor Y)
MKMLNLPRRVLAHRRYLARQGGATHDVGTPLHGLDDLRSLPLPPVQVVDLAAELKAGNRSIFSRPLQHAMRETLGAGEQVILFLNRRGTATFVMCRDCGYVMHCAGCGVPLTYHEGQDTLICHHCNRRQPNPQHCPACQGGRIRYFGLGTERVESAVREAFPAARLLRWDLDSVRLGGSHEAYLEEFASGRANVLIGTQMIAKGLDLPRVTLVGVISADTSLYLPDFRAAERTFQLLMQVAGRAGRSPLGGRVIIQTYHADLPLIQAAAAHDYASFYHDELQSRLTGHYPPFKRLARLVYMCSGAERAQCEAERVAQLLRSRVLRLGEPGVDIVGPAPCFYFRLRGEHRWHVIVRANQPEVLLRPLTLPLGWRVDVDPVDLL